MQFRIAPNTDLHPGIHEKQWDKLVKARDLGFRVLRMANFGTVRTKDIPNSMYVEHDEGFLRYAELLGNCNDFITELGCGQAAYNQFKAQFNLVGSGGLYQTNRRKNSGKRLLNGLMVKHFQHTTGQVMTSFVQTIKLGVQVLDLYFIIKIERNWKKRLVSK